MTSSLVHFARAQYHKLPTNLREKMKPFVRVGFQISPRVGGVLRFFRFCTSHKIVWLFYSKGLRTRALMKGTAGAADHEFAKTGLKQGVVPKELIDPLIQAFSKAGAAEIKKNDYLPGFWHNKELETYTKSLNLNHTYLNLGPEQAKKLAPVLEQLREPVGRCFGSPWQVVNIRSWKTKPGAETTGPNGWHKDGFPYGIFKMLLYLTPPGPESGTTEIILKNGKIQTIKGPAGTWVMFQNSSLTHRGVAPTMGERVVIEITAVPTTEHDLQPVFTGLNAMHPKWPWFKVSKDLKLTKEAE